jgi:8-oxo-dGTP pyrophosphatase MutT (NUDIX family)
MAANADPRRPRALRPRDAATLIILDRSGDAPRVLMGRRRPDQAFLPNKYVFPGGRLERADCTTPSSAELEPSEQGALLIGLTGRPNVPRVRGLAIAAIRETFEETGLMISAPGARPMSDGASWSSLIATGVLPDLSGLRYIARAITPPGRQRRYDTRFFCVDASRAGQRMASTDGELSDLNWLTLAETRGLDLPNITRRVVDDVADLLSGSCQPQSPRPIPFYFQRYGVSHRALLSHKAGSP